MLSDDITITWYKTLLIILLALTHLFCYFVLSTQSCSHATLLCSNYKISQQPDSNRANLLFHHHLINKTNERQNGLKLNKKSKHLLLMLAFFYLFLCENYPPKLSNAIMSSSTPREWRRSRTVLAIIGGPQR